jgi:hypothetical protein
MTMRLAFAGVCSTLFVREVVDGFICSVAGGLSRPMNIRPHQQQLIMESGLGTRE